MASCSSQIKLGKSDGNHVIYTDHFVHGTNRSCVILSLMFSSMVCIAGKLLDKIILQKSSDAFLTLDQQFGFKKHHSTTQCTFNRI